METDNAVEAGDVVEAGNVVEAGDAVEAGDVVEAGDAVDAGDAVRQAMRWRLFGGGVACNQSAALFMPAICLFTSNIVCRISSG